MVIPSGSVPASANRDHLALVASLVRKRKPTLGDRFRLWDKRFEAFTFPSPIPQHWPEPNRHRYRLAAVVQRQAFRALTPRHDGKGRSRQAAGCCILPALKELTAHSRREQNRESIIQLYRWTGQQAFTSALGPRHHSLFGQVCEPATLTDVQHQRENLSLRPLVTIPILSGNPRVVVSGLQVMRKGGVLNKAKHRPASAERLLLQSTW